VQSAVTANLAGLASTDPTTNQNAVNAVKSSVNDTVQSAIRSRLTLVEQLEVREGILTPDTVIDSSSTSLSTTTGQSFQIAFRNTPVKPSSVYNIDAVLQLRPVICEAELNAVNQDQVLVNGLEVQLGQMKSQLAKAPVSEKKKIQQDIDDFTKEQLNPAKAKLAKDTQALARVAPRIPRFERSGSRLSRSFQSFPLRENLTKGIREGALEDQKFYFIDRTRIVGEGNLRVHVLARELRIAPHISGAACKARCNPHAIRR
jgi:hypothetical protein